MTDSRLVIQSALFGVLVQVVGAICLRSDGRVADLDDDERGSANPRSFATNRSAESSVNFLLRVGNAALAGVNTGRRSRRARDEERSD